MSDIFRKQVGFFENYPQRNQFFRDTDSRFSRFTIDLENKKKRPILIVKKTYEELLEILYDHKTFFYIDDSKRGRTNVKHFQKILKFCKEENVTVTQYLSLLLQNCFIPQAWKYPYLPYVASEKAFEVFRKEKELLKELRLANEAEIKRMIREESPLNLRKKFYNCFREGFPVVYDFYKRNLLEDETCLFMIFYKFNAVFTPEFIVTHSKFNDFLEMGTNGVKANALMNRIEALHVRTAIFRYVKSAYQKMKSKKVYASLLLSSREMVSCLELALIEKEFGQKEDWREAWALLI